MTASRSAVASSTSVVALVPVNTGRKGIIIVNNSTANLYVICGSGGSTTDFTQKIATNGVFTLTLGVTDTIRGVWDAANGNALITEFVE